MDTIEYLRSNNFNGLDDELIIKSELYKYDIIVSYESNITDGKRRFIFSSSDRSKKVFKNNLCTEANGLVLEAPNWEILVLPTFSPKNNVDTTIINNLLYKQLYDVYYIEDGTIVNFYFYPPVNNWVMSSTKGIDIGDNIFNKLTYSQMFEESLEKFGILPQEFYSMLNPDVSYTFGFKHPDIHPFMEGKEELIYKVWFVQYVDIRYTKIPNKVKIIIPIEKKSPFFKIPNHRDVEFTVNNISVLFSKLKNSFTDFMESKTCNYGFLLVAKNINDFEDNISYSTILLDSSLMNSIKKLWYDNTYIKYSKLKSFNRVKTVLLNSFLDNNRFESFNILFPQYRESLDVFNEIECELTDKIYNNLKSQDTIMLDEHEEEISYGYIVDILSAKVADLITIDSHERPKQKIRDIIHNNEHIDYYYYILNQKKILTK